MGVVHYCATDYWPHNTVLYVTDFLGNDERFTYYFLQKLNLRRFDSGSAQASLNRNYIYPIRIVVPRPEEQRVIGNILGALDDKIALNQKISATLEAMAGGLFRSWFVDFDPVVAKIEGLDACLPKGLADLFPDSFEDSELGAIPRGWTVQSFASVVDIIGGGTPKTSVTDYWGGDIPWFSVVDAPNGADTWVVETEKKITRAGLENSSARILPVGTTIISARGTVGRVALVGVPMAMNQSCYGLRDKKSGHAFFTYFATRALVARLQQHAHGSVFDTITRNTLAGVSVALPPSELIDAFEARVGPSMERLLSGQLESRTLADLRDTLPPPLTSGRPRVNRGPFVLVGLAHCTRKSSFRHRYDEVRRIRGRRGSPRVVRGPWLRSPFRSRYCPG